jgi:hypothetical protein
LDGSLSELFALSGHFDGKQNRGPLAEFEPEFSGGPAYRKISIQTELQ